MSDTQFPEVLLVHGAWHGSWCWDRLVAVLESHGRRVHVVDLPTACAPNSGDFGVADDAAMVAAAVESIGDEVVVVGHSYGGIPVTVACTSPNVHHIVYVAAFVLDEGESLVSMIEEPEDWWFVDGPVCKLTDVGQAPELFYHDVDPAATEAAVSRLRPQSLRSFTDTVTDPVWRSRSTTYVITDRDGAFPVADQEALAARARSIVHRMDTSHSPFLSQPEALARIIEAVPPSA